jgi:thiamine kinase-like enzyme
LLLEINHIHQTKITKTVLKHDYLDCWKKAKLPEIHKNKYLQLIHKYKNLSLMLCHNDLNAENVLIDKQQRLVFIDYEWGRLNNKYWDIANFIRETKLPTDKIKYILSSDKTIDSQILYNFIYICTNYAYQWTFNMKPTAQILYCRKLNLMKMNKYYKTISCN